MISLILPYWNRQETADKALAILDRHYSGLDLEVIVVDDGNRIPFKVPETSLNLRVITLPKKDEPKSPCLCWNEGVKAARGDVIALSCIEVLHDKPVFAEMLGELEKAGPDGYVLAAAWCPEQKAWHTHSTVEVPECPKGAGLGFLGLLHRELYERAGGWDEEYREGAGYEDRDFIHRLTKVGAKFIKRDDLVVTHPKKGASIAWGAEKFIRNRDLFSRKWLVPVTFTCVQAGNYCGRGVEYVNTLYDMVSRNVSRPFRFVCLTDDEAGLHQNIETIPLPKDLEGWYGKLYLFKKGLFADGERVVFMDLDTVILGRLDEIASYKGQFATLRDFYFPQQVGPAVMLWEAGGIASTIWREWVACGKPRDPMGDLWWINNLDQGRFAHRCDKLQDLFPKQFVSFKANCKHGIPKGARVVCFHGKPRPHEVDGWVDVVWRVGGQSPADLEVVSNTDQDQVSKNVKAACLLDLPWLPLVAAHDDEICIVAGGPSLVDYLPELHGKKIVAVNGAHDFLISKGITPDVHLMIDARSENADFITKQAKEYWLASQCDPGVFEKAGMNVTVIHMNTVNVLDSIPPSIKPINLISSGSTVALAGMAVSYCLGYRSISVYGMDSSYEESRHAYPQSLNDGDRVIEATAGGRVFKCAPWMVAQVQHFQTLVAELTEDDCEINVRCGGLLGHVAWLMMREANAAVKHAA